MSARSLVFSRLTTDVTLNDLGITVNSTFLTHDVDTPAARPMLILRWQRRDPALRGADKGMQRWRLLVWAHDTPGNYDRIDSILQRVRDVLTNVVATFTGTTDLWVIQTNWHGDSEDLRDDDAGTFTRYSEFTIVGSV